MVLTTLKYLKRSHHLIPGILFILSDSGSCTDRISDLRGLKIRQEPAKNPLAPVFGGNVSYRPRYGSRDVRPVVSQARLAQW